MKELLPALAPFHRLAAGHPGVFLRDRMPLASSSHSRGALDSPPNLIPAAEGHNLFTAAQHGCSRAHGGARQGENRDHQLLGLQAAREHVGREAHQADTERPRHRHQRSAKRCAASPSMRELLEQSDMMAQDCAECSRRQLTRVSGRECRLINLVLGSQLVNVRAV